MIIQPAMNGGPAVLAGAADVRGAALLTPLLPARLLARLTALFQRPMKSAKILIVLCVVCSTGVNDASADQAGMDQLSTEAIAVDQAAVDETGAERVARGGAILIGGGYDLHSSQGQIELNVKWVQGILEKRGLNLQTYFTDGDESGPDVHYLIAPDAAGSVMEPLARVFGDWHLESTRYRENQVSGVAGSTRRDELEPKLRDILADPASDDLLLVYNGHGSQSFSTADQVTINLWDNSTLSASELHALLRERRGAFRFVFTQCYSGGFHRLAFADPAEGLALATSPRCGFTAESAYRLAEGCSASIETDDYRDYTTYFFSALSGFERNGEIISHDPDLDGNGEITLREAHLFTLEEAFSTDLSRSTSEEYLTEWQPWYLRWLPASKSLPNNDYSRVFRNLASRYDIVLDKDSLKRIRQKLTRSEGQLTTLIEQQQLLQETILDLQYGIQSELIRAWPELMGPYSGAYLSMAIDGELPALSASIEAHPAYQKLLAAQTRSSALELEALDAERQATQYQKMLHLRHLALLQQQLATYGSAQERTDYQSLVACESVPLGGGSPDERTLGGG